MYNVCIIGVFTFSLENSAAVGLAPALAGCDHEEPTPELAALRAQRVFFPARSSYAVPQGKQENICSPLLCLSTVPPEPHTRHAPNT